MTVSNALDSCRATSAQQICGLSAFVASPTAFSSSGFAASASGVPNPARAIAAVPRTVWSTDPSPFVMMGMLALSLAHDRWTYASCCSRGSLSASAHLRQRGNCSALGKSWMSRISLFAASLVIDCASAWAPSRMAATPPATMSRPRMIAMGLKAPRLKLPSSVGKALFMAVARLGKGARTIP